MHTKNKIKAVMGYLYKHFVLALFIILVIIVTTLIIRDSFYKTIVLFIGLIFLPFIDLLNQYLSRSRDRFSVFKPTFWGLSFKEFITAWMTFWGVLGVVFGIIQAQKQIFYQDKQLSIQNEQIKTQKEQFYKQLSIQNKQLSDTRFSSGIEFLGGENDYTRIAGAYNLYLLANEDSAAYLDPVCEILCDHIRTVTSDTSYKIKYKYKPSNEIQAILDLLFKNKNKNFIFDKCKKDLTETFLCGANFNAAKLSHVDFKEATLNGTAFLGTVLSDIDFREVALIDVNFTATMLNKVDFTRATLNYITFCPNILNPTLANTLLIDSIYINPIYDTRGPRMNFKGVYLADGLETYFMKTLLKDVNFENAKLSHISCAAKLYNIDFDEATLEDVNFYPYSGGNIDFATTSLYDADFTKAKLNNVNFSETPLKGYSYEEITREGRSLELTKSKGINEK